MQYPRKRGDNVGTFQCPQNRRMLQKTTKVYLRMYESEDFDYQTSALYIGLGSLSYQQIKF